MPQRPDDNDLPADEFATQIPDPQESLLPRDESSTVESSPADTLPRDQFATIGSSPAAPSTPSIRYEAMVRGDRIGDFLIQRLLGRGSFGAVYLARELSLDRLVALKIVLPAGQNASPGEGRSLARLKHANIVGVYGETIDPTSGCLLLWMQFVDGCTLAGLIQRLHGDDLQQTWSEQDLLGFMAKSPAEMEVEGESIRSMESVCRIGSALAEALDHAHSCEITHRDIKPANILMDRDGTALLADFNLAEETSACQDSMGGTIAYMAPEQMSQLLGNASAHTVGPRSDLYSLGMVLWELTSGKRPHQRAEEALQPTGRGRWQELLRIRETDVPADHSQVPIGLAMVLRRAMMADPSQRYPSASAMATALRGLSELQRARRGAPMVAGALHLVRRNLFWIMLAGGLLPHIAASVMQSYYNWIWVPGIDKDAFKKAFITYNVVVYPACIGWLAWNLYRFGSGYRRVVEREPVPRGELRKLRGRLLRLPRQFMIAAAVGWFPGALLFPKLLDGFSQAELPPQDTFHLFVSFVIAGLIATTYSYAIVLYIVVCHGYRACWQTASHYRDRVRYELKGWQTRIRRLSILAGVLPLAAAALLLAIEIPTIAELPFPGDPALFHQETAQIANLLKLVIGLIFFGAIGLYIVEKSAARMIQAVRALTLSGD
jgi:serine/threonine protein kinase